MKRNIYLAQCNTTFGRSAFLPYSVGLLQAFAQTNKIIREEYDFKELLYLREPVADVVKRMERPDVFGGSVYIWNSSYTLALAKAVKEAHPECLIVLGGPHVPVKDYGDGLNHGYLSENPFADVLVHYEGEEAFAEILLERLNVQPNYAGIAGLTVKLSREGASLKTLPRNRMADLDSIPSPYLTGIFDRMMMGVNDLSWQPTSEVDRGCPYACTFCDWGSSVFTKVRRFDQERLYEEINWFASRKASLLYNASANFGITDKDVELTERMVKVKRDTGFPEKFRAAYAKNSNERVFQISKLLNDAGMSKGTTLSFQSMDPNVLELVKRKNVKMDNFKELMRRYRAEGIPTYSELIIGLPGESYDTFANGIDALISAGQHDSLQVYVCECLPNSEMSEPAYRERHGIRTTKTPVLFFHGTPQANDDPHQEHYELVTETQTLSPADWLRCQLFSCIVQACHCLGLTQAVAVFLNAKYGVSYRRFYERLLEWALKSLGTVLGEAFWTARKQFYSLQRGEEWGGVDQRFGNVVWPPEEFAFLNVIAEKERFYVQLLNWLLGWVEESSPILLSDLVRYQETVVKSPDAGRKLFTNYNVHEYVQDAYVGESVTGQGLEFKAEGRTYQADGEASPDFETFAKEQVWFSRKGGSFSRKVVAE